MVRAPLQDDAGLLDKEAWGRPGERAFATLCPGTDSTNGMVLVTLTGMTGAGEDTGEI